MYTSEISVWTIISLCVFFIAFEIFKRGWLYYYSVILPGPFTVPFIGSLKIVFCGQQGIFQKATQLVKVYPSRWRFWLGNQMYIVTSKPSHAEYILTRFLEKKTITVYEYMEEITSSIISTIYNRWKNHRKNLNPTFGPKLMNIYFEVFVKYANKLTIDLGQSEQETDVLLVVWSNTLNIVFETLGAVDPAKLSTKVSKFIPMILKFEKLILNRVVNPLYYFNIFWKISPSYKKLTLLRNEAIQLLRKIFEDHVSNNSENHFINNLKKGDYYSNPVEEEMLAMFTAASETTALTVGVVLLVMGIYPDVQTKLYEEIQSVFDSSTEDITMKDLTKLEYLDRVIKETLRVFPPIPMIARHLDKTIKLDGQVFPAGSNVVFPIFHMHQNPEFWPDPQKFDPDRFLPEEVQKRPRCAYLAFSHGPRNCIGLIYGLISLKVLLVKIIRKFEVLPGNYTSVAEIEVDYHILAKPKDGYKVTLKQRNKN